MKKLRLGVQDRHVRSGIYFRVQPQHPCSGIHVSTMGVMDVGSGVPT